MRTISSDKSLVFWRHTVNGANITRVNDLFLKENYYSVFEQLKQKSSIDGLKVNFLDMWHYIVNAECEKLKKKLSALTTDKIAIDLVKDKFRGNLGEILVEKLFLDFGMTFDIIPSSYVTVDPTNEGVLDAEGIHPGDGLPMGIQVKNFTRHCKGRSNGVTRDTFFKSSSMTTHWVQDLKIIPDEKLITFKNIPRQIIFSFTDVDDQRVLTDYKGSVRFIGPKEIKKLELENKSYVFAAICDEISKL